MMQDSRSWTKLEPEVDPTGVGGAPTFSLQSEAGLFECSVSGLRWVCEENTSFQYHFCSWGGHMERVENSQYTSAGPIFDVAVTAGKLCEMYLPHWICTDDIPDVLDKLAVLHIDDCGDFVEKVHEVTPTHVRLKELAFFPRAVVMRLGTPVKVSCNVLLYYKPNTSFLKLHVYLVPNDPALQQKVDKLESCCGYEKITKPRPEKQLRLHQGFSLTADSDSAQIHPKKITLRNDSPDPHFYEVHIEYPERCISLQLQPALSRTHEPASEPVWTCELRRGDYPKSGYSQASRRHVSC